jgi:hypothetical protein
MMVHRAIDFALQDDSAPTRTFLGTEEKGLVWESFRFPARENVLGRSKDATRRRQRGGLADHQKVVGLVSLMFTSVMACKWYSIPSSA